MQFVINNPYRILGLTANASSREVAKRVTDLETFAEFGKIKKYPLDLAEISPLTRTVDTIRQAAKDIESDTEKLVYAFFWFAKVDSVDELAIECIEKNQVQKEEEIIQDDLEYVNEIKSYFKTYLKENTTKNKDNKYYINDIKMFYK